MGAYLCPRRHNGPAVQSNTLREEPESQQRQVIRSPIEQWRLSPRRLQNLEIFLSQQPNFHLIRQELATFRKSIIDRHTFSNILRCYRSWLEREMNQHGQIRQYQMSNQLKIVDYELRLLPLLQSGIFSYTELSQLSGSSPKELIHEIVHRPVVVSQRRALLFSLMPQCIEHIDIFLQEYLQFNLNVDDSVLLVLLFPQTEIDKLAERGIKYEPAHIFKESARWVCRRFKNYSLASKMIQLVMDNYRDEVQNCTRLLFIIKICSFFLYEQNHSEIDYDRVSGWTRSQLIHEILSEDSGQNLEQLKAIFDILGQGQLQSAYEQYVFSELCPLATSIQLLEQQRIEPTESAILQLLQKVRRGHFEYSRHIDNLEILFEKFDHYEDIEKMIEVLKYASLFYGFGINDRLKNIEGLLAEHDDLQSLQQHALKLFRGILIEYCTRKEGKWKVYLKGHMYDLEQPQNLLKLALELKKQLFGRLLSQSLIHQMIFQHLLAYGKLSQLERLLKTRILQEYNIDYSMVEVIVVEHLLQLFDDGHPWEEIAPQAQYFVELLKTKSTERRLVRTQYKLLSYLHKQGCLPAGSRLPRRMDINYLYGLLNLNMQLDFDKIYKYMLKIREQSLNKVNIHTKEYMKFQGELALRYLKKSYYQQAMETLNKLEKLRPTWLCAIILKALRQQPDIPQHHKDKLSMLAYESCVTAQQFQELFNLSNKNTGERSFSISPEQLYRKYLNSATKYVVSQSDFILSESQYTNIVAESKFQVAVLRQADYQMYFVLFCSDFIRAQHYAFKKSLDVEKLDDFYNRCVKADIVDIVQLAPYVVRLLDCRLRKEAAEPDMTFKDFKKTLAMDEVLRIQARWKNTQNNITTLLNKYIQIFMVVGSVPMDVLLKNIQPKKQFNKFLMEPGYRRHRLLEIPSVLDNNEIMYFQKLARMNQLDYFELILQSLLNHINTEVVPKSAGVLISSLSRLIEADQKKAMEAVQRLTQKAHGARMLALLLQYMKKNSKILSQAILEPNISLFDSFSRLEKRNEFRGLVPRDFITKKIQPCSKNIKLSKEHQQKIKEVVTMDNAYVLSKFMYFVYGMNEKVEQETLRIAKNKMPQLPMKANLNIF